MKKVVGKDDLKTLKQIDEISEVSSSSEETNSEGSGVTLDKNKHAMH